jgi:hypothetical protein
MVRIPQAHGDSPIGIREMGDAAPPIPPTTGRCAPDPVSPLKHLFFITF